MALWLVRAGSMGEHEARFFTDGAVYPTWRYARCALSGFADRQALRAYLREVYPDETEGALVNWSGQLWAFVHGIEVGDWIVLPLKTKAAIAFAEVIGGYEYCEKAEPPYWHRRKVKWFATDVPRSAFGQDLLYSFGAFMTICRIERNDAERRIRSMAASEWTPEVAPVGDQRSQEDPTDLAGASSDLERLGRDLIAKTIIRKFKGHAMAVLVEAILKAQGYTTFRSPEGPDNGVDILAAPGPLGFGRPRIAVQVKSSESPVDRPTLDQLIGAMQNVQADQGLLVAWGGFRTSIDREMAHHFFRVRLWDQDALIDQLLAQYNALDEDLRTELPLKRIWTVATPEAAD